MKKVLGVTVVALVIQGNPFFLPDFEPALLHAQRYQEKPALRKGRAREAMFKAMENNAKVEMMVIQQSLDTKTTSQLLRASYGFQVTAITQIEGLLREASFHDPVIAKGIQDMYDYGKPNTMEAAAAIERGDLNAALGHLRAAKIVHQRFIALCY